MASRLKERLAGAVRAGLGAREKAPGKGTTAAKAEGVVNELDLLGIHTVHFASSDEDLVEYTDKLWDEQNDPVAERQKEWLQIEHYVANEQYLAYHRGRRDWIVRRSVPWRIRSTYNISSKCVELRVQRLTENKPAISVQAATVDRGDVDKAEYKQTLFWGLWEKLGLHKRIVGVRTKATLNACGFLKVGWDPDAGVECPETRKRVKMVDAMEPVIDPATQQPAIGPDGQPLEQPTKKYGGIEEYYVDSQGNDLGPVESMVPDDDNPGEQKTIRNPVPDKCEQYPEGEVFVDERRAANIRWDRYVDDVDESWYVQDSEVLSGFKIVQTYGEEILKVLKDATPATEDDKLTYRSALMSREAAASDGSSDRSYKPRDSEEKFGSLDDEYVVRETWIYPTSPLLKKLWGKEGCKIVTIGGQLASKSALPKWAIRKRNFIRFIDLPEEGNHYGKPMMRDILPLQDDINRTRSQMSERGAIESRLILGAPQNHQMNLRLLGGMPGVLLTYRDAAHKPEPINLTQQGQGNENFYRSSLEAATDLGNMNDASTGKLPSAGLAAKAIYALQYADERSIAKTSTLQDESLKRLAFAIDAVTRAEYTEARKVRLTGEDREFLVESEILPDQLDTDVDYFFTPGSMLSKQKEAVRNEMLSLLEAGMIDQATARKFIATAVPDVFRTSNDLHEAKARRNLQAILRRGEQPEAAPWDNADVHLNILTEYMLTRKWDVTGEEEKAKISQLWQAFSLQKQNLEAAAAAAAQAAKAPTGSGAPPGPVDAPPAGDGGMPGGAAELEDKATKAKKAPEPGVGRPADAAA